MNRIALAIPFVILASCNEPLVVDDCNHRNELFLNPYQGTFFNFTVQGAGGMIGDDSVRADGVAYLLPDGRVELWSGVFSNGFRVRFILPRADLSSHAIEKDSVRVEYNSSDMILGGFISVGGPSDTLSSALSTDGKTLSGTFQFRGKKISLDARYPDTARVWGAFKVEIDSTGKPTDCVYDFHAKAHRCGFINPDCPD